MRHDSIYSIYRLKSLCVVFTFTLVSIIFILNLQSVYSENPEISFLDVNTTSSVSKFSVAAWFKTSTDYKSDAFIVNKAGAGDNMNYGIWMTNAEKVQAGFETSTGKPMYATSPFSYSDGKWHYAVVTFDGSVINLYVDGIQVATKSASGSPDNGGNQPVRMGANSEALSDYFIGDVDEIRVWRVALTPEQVNDAYHNTFDTKYQELYLDFSQPIALINETSIVNETAINASAINASAINGSAINASAINASAINGSAINGSAINGSAINGTGILAVNETANNKTSSLSKLIARNDTGIANETNDIQPAGIPPQILNDTGISNETRVQNQTSESQLPKENNPPIAFDQSVSVDKNGQIGISMVANDEDKDQVQFDITADPLQGTLDNFNKEKGTLNYVPQKDYSGDDKFSFRVIDNKGAGSNEATVDISVNEPSQPIENQETGLPKSVEESSNQTGTQQATEKKSVDESSNQTSTEQATETKSVEEPNQPPKADAGEDQKSAVNTEVKLDGSKSSDEDGKLVSYKWEQTDGAKVDLKADEETASFDVPESAAVSKLAFKLTVVDDKAASDSDDVTVEVEAQENISPKADAGGNQKAEVNSEVKLDGGKSSDEDGKLVSYKWEQTDGPKVDLNKADEETASFDVPESAADSKLAFKLTVVDDKDASDSDDITVEVEKSPESESESQSESESN
jgi:Concanavalin A-like lectin/glucanases superfamily/K319L-like, PKD domain/Bacterial Ig domain